MKKIELFSEAELELARTLVKLYATMKLLTTHGDVVPVSLGSLSRSCRIPYGSKPHQILAATLLELAENGYLKRTCRVGARYVLTEAGLKWLLESTGGPLKLKLLKRVPKLSKNKEYNFEVETT